MTQTRANAYLIGGGIASLAAAVFLVRDAEFDPEHIHVFEASDVLGGSLDGSGNPTDGYVIRGGRMFEPHFGCTFDLFDSIPALDRADLSVTEDIRRFTRDVHTSSKCRLMVDGARVQAPRFELGLRDKWDLVRLTQTPEHLLAGRTIDSWFAPRFFHSNFWVMWCTMFAFRQWHSLAEMRRYMRRFMHLLPGFNRLEGIYRTRLNQYDSLVVPTVSWLRRKGVNFHLNCGVTDLDFDDRRSTVRTIRFASAARYDNIDVAPDDRVLVTLGSMTEESALGSMYAPPAPSAAPLGTDAWPLWRRIATKSRYFGRPDAFASDTDATRWLSFTVTMPHARFFEHLHEVTGNAAGTGGLVTFKHSAWLMSVVLAYQPHFANQPQDVCVFWGYGLHPEQRGDHVRKPMLDCSGAEILAELAFHLRLGTAATTLFESANCIPCLMPFITAQFMPRKEGDRPRIIPEGAKNFAFLGQFVEMPDDTVFTVEYSVRSAQTAVHGLCGGNRRPVAPYRGWRDPLVVGRALRTIICNGA